MHGFRHARPSGRFLLDLPPVLPPLGHLPAMHAGKVAHEARPAHAAPLELLAEGHAEVLVLVVAAQAQYGHDQDQVVVGLGLGDVEPPAEVGEPQAVLPQAAAEARLGGGDAVELAQPRGHVLAGGLGQGLLDEVVDELRVRLGGVVAAREERVADVEAEGASHQQAHEGAVALPLLVGQAGGIPAGAEVLAGCPRRPGRRLRHARRGRRHVVREAVESQGPDQDIVPLVEVLVPQQPWDGRQVQRRHVLPRVRARCTQVVCGLRRWRQRVCAGRGEVLIAVEPLVLAIVLGTRVGILAVVEHAREDILTGGPGRRRPCLSSSSSLAVLTRAAAGC